MMVVAKGSTHPTGCYAALWQRQSGGFIDAGDVEVAG